MRLGTVVGPVWGAKKATGLQGHKLLVVQDAARGRMVAVDRLGAGPGDRVLVAHGSRVRDLTLGEAVPVKDVIVAIVDDVAPEEGDA
jgi:ethanolamine utilization protein EutN